MASMFLFVLFTVFSASVSGDCDVDTLRCCITDFLSLLSLENGFHVSQENINRTCKHRQDSESCLLEYDGQCRDLGGEDLTQTIKNTKYVINDLCSPSSEFAIVFKEQACPDVTKEELESCVEAYSVNKESTSSEGSDDHKWASTCCEYKALKECTIDISKNKCKEKVSDFIEKIVTNVNGLGYEIACEQDFPKCSNLAVQLPLPTLMILLGVYLTIFRS